MEKEILEKMIIKALKLLSRRPQSQKEMEVKLNRFLARKKVEGKSLYLKHVLKYLKKGNYLNDQEFARWFTSQRAQFRPRSKKALYFELKQKSIPEKIIKTVLENYNEEKACQKLLRKKSSVSKQQAISYLLRQGFPFRLIEKSLKMLKKPTNSKE